MLSGAASVTGVIDGGGGGITNNQASNSTSANTAPQTWWHRFCTHEYPHLHQSKPPTALLAYLTKGIELFRSEEHRKDPFTLKIWLAYLHCHWSCYGDEEEVRRLFKFLRTERVGGWEGAPELVLHFAHFELNTGRREKCTNILEGAIASSSTPLQNNEQLRKAMVEYRLLGTFRLPPLISSLEGGEFPSKPVPDPNTTSIDRVGNSVLNASTNNNLVQPPPTPISPVPLVQDIPMVSALATPVSNIPPGIEERRMPTEIVTIHHHNLGNNNGIPSGTLANNISSAVPSSEIKATEEQRAALSFRIRRLGLGPPKRTILPAISSPRTTPSLAENSPNDSTVPRATIDPSPLPRLEDHDDVQDDMHDSPPHSPTRSTSTLTNHLKKASRLAMDKDEVSTTVKRRDGTMVLDQMSLTTISPTTHRLIVDGNKREITTTAATARTAEGLAATTIPQPAYSEPLNSTNSSMTKPKVVKINGRSYRVLSLIGKGGSSRVFKVLSGNEHSTIYALKKVNLKNLDETTIGGYINEINLLRSFGDAPHIIKLIDCEVNREHGFIYMVMEYGEIDLSKLLRTKAAIAGGIDANFVRYIWQQMLQAVQTVHVAKIVHCDLKPANFLLVAGTLKLIDFGISKAIVTNDTTNIVRENQVGTVNYMSPEALQESNSSTGGSGVGRIKIGRASDIWSLGCILYEMVYGRPPFAKFSLIQRLQKILDPCHEIEFPPLSLALHETSLLSVMKACLVRSAKRRPSLEELLEHQFLQPNHNLLIPVDSILISKQQLGDLISMLAKHIPNLDAVALTEKVFSQWKELHR